MYFVYFVVKTIRMDIIYREESYKIIGACFEVYKEKGCGFLEPVYQECMEIELGLQGIPFRAQAALKLEYKGHPLKHGYQPDFICYDKIIVELKAVTELTDEHRAQVHNYLSAAQPQPNARGARTALAASIPLCSAALKGATSSPSREMRVKSADEQFEGKSFEPHADLRFQGRLSNITLQRPHCGDRTAPGQRSRY